MSITVYSRQWVSKLGGVGDSQQKTGCSTSGSYLDCSSSKAIKQCRIASVSKCRELQKNSSLQARVKRGWVTTAGSPIVAMTPNKSGEEVRTKGESAAADLRRILEAPGVHQGPACYDALSARLVQQAGFSYTFMSGFAVSAVRLGAPDVGLLSYGEVLEQGRLITSAVSIPVIGDGDTGYGNALSVKRTVKGFIQAGFAGILIEDQVSPKSCGHFGGKMVVAREEAVTRIRAAVDARSEARGDIVIIARSDARQAESLEEALWRVEQFAQLGADVVFIDALASKDEMLAFCKVAPSTPKMANMLEGGGRTPILSPLELGELGFKLVAYPLSLVGVSIRAMQDALKAIKSGRLPPPGDLPTFDEIKEVVGIRKYYEEDERYASLQLPTFSSAGNGTLGVSADAEKSQSLVTDGGAVDLEGTIPILEGDIISNIPDIQGIPGVPEDSVFVESNPLDDKDTSSTQGSLSAVWSRVLRIKITGSTGNVKLDVRIPAGFLDGLSSTIPDASDTEIEVLRRAICVINISRVLLLEVNAISKYQHDALSASLRNHGVAGLNLQKLLDDAVFKLRGNLESGQLLLDFSDRRGERIQVFLE